MMISLLEDVPFFKNDEVSVLVNSLGATPKEELFIIYRKAYEMLKDLGIRVHRPYIGEYATSLEMAGASISLLKLDDELKALLDAPAQSLFLNRPRPVLFSRVLKTSDAYLRLSNEQHLKSA